MDDTATKKQNSILVVKKTFFTEFEKTTHLKKLVKSDEDVLMIKDFSNQSI